MVDSVLSVLDPSHLNYEHRTSLTLTIKATDNGSPPLDVTADVTIKIIDVNEPPDGISLIPANVSIREDAAVGQCIARIASQNPEPGQAVAFTLLNFQETFDISRKCTNSSINGQAVDRFSFLHVKSHLNYNQVPSYAILINAMDNGIPPQSFNGTVAVHVEKVDPCLAGVRDCHVHSTCRRVDWQNYTCPCVEGFTGSGAPGSDCVEIDECLSAPCLNGGTCRDALGNYTCECLAGYDNLSNCEIIDTCQSSPCQNNGSCSVVPNNYTCFCAVGFEGYSCENNIDDCEKIGCVKGQCQDGIASFTCKCADGYTGTLCQREVEACGEDACDEDQVCIQPDVSQEYTEKCFPESHIIALLFHPSQVIEDEVASAHWQWRLEGFLKQNLQIPYGDLTDDIDDGRTVSINDVVVTGHGTERGEENEQENENGVARKKRGRRDEGTLFTAIRFVAVVANVDSGRSVPEVTFFRALNDTCRTYNCKDIPTATFECIVCRAGYEMIARKGELSSPNEM